MKTIKYKTIKVKEYKRILKEYMDDFEYYKLDEIKEYKTDLSNSQIYKYINTNNLGTNKLAEDFLEVEGDPFFILEDAPIEFVTGLYYRLYFVILELEKLKCNNKIILCDKYGNNNLSLIALALMGYNYDETLLDNLILPVTYKENYYIVKREDHARNNQKISK